MQNLFEIRAELGLGDLYPPDEVVREVQTIMEETGFKERLRQVREGAGESGSDPASAHDDDRE
jgi:hypothetical protein